MFACQSSRDKRGEFLIDRSRPAVMLDGDLTVNRHLASARMRSATVARILRL
jgi:hypothetical protein